jgi:histidinol-phosphate/aromatic aminotransferase/cobyric acid decarboxylase-like protein
MATFRLVCPVFAADSTVIGHGTADGYSTGGAYSHATRCEAMATLANAHGVEVTARAAGRAAIETEDAFFAAMVEKSAAKSEPVAAQASETVVIDGKTYTRSA